MRYLYLASLIAYTFGALSFSILTATYWRERRSRRKSGGLVFPLFTLCCGAAFVINLLLQAASAVGIESGATVGLDLVLHLVTACLPAFLLHLVCVDERPSGCRWVALFYAACGVGGVLKGLSDSSLADFGDWIDRVPAVMFGASGALGLVMQAISRRKRTPAEQRYRARLMVLLALAVLAAAATLAAPGPFVVLLPDYLLLSFFCVTLYYKERPVFFDVLIKRGGFLAVGMVGISLVLVPLWGVAALLATPLWLIGPWVYERLAGFVDRVWLRRRFAPADAERYFIGEVQVAGTEEELRAKSAASLGEIFQTTVEVSFDGAEYPRPSGSHGEFAEAAGQRPAPQGDPQGHEYVGAYLTEQSGGKLGAIRLDPRPSAIPFLSDDRRLLDSLARTLSVLLENVRFRQQRQELRWLASRAELKALRAQINPHFLFNALNTIAGLIQDRPQLADETIERLAQVFRYTLRRSEREWVRLDEEVEAIAAYLRIEQARFGERLAVRLEVDPAAAGISIPAMSIQPLIENAMKHGVAMVEGPGTVELRAALLDDVLAVEVFDNGPGFPPGFGLRNGGPGHGLRNVAERLHGYYGESAGLQWESGANGTRVTIRIPCAPVAELPGGQPI